MQVVGGRSSREISGPSVNWQGYLRRTSGLGLRRISRDMTDIGASLGISASTSRDSYGSSWGKCMWRKHRSVYQDHMQYIRNYIVKPFKVKIICYAERMCDMHDLAKYLHPPTMKGKRTEAANWTSRNQEFTPSEILIEIKDGLPLSMNVELEDYPEEYHSLTYEYCCDLLSKIKVKDKRKG